MEEKMIKRARISLKIYNSFSNIKSSKTSNKQFSPYQIEEFFAVKKMQVYELDYLYHSEHFSTCQPYQELVHILEDYNEQAKKVNDSQDANTVPSNILNQVKIICMKLIYQEMLVIAVMENWQLQQTKLATKVRDWYQQLGDIHSFLEGVNIKKKDLSKDPLKEEVCIRRNYISNVFDQIDDYLRKKMDYSKDTKKGTQITFQKNPKLYIHEKKDSCNLPLIDTMLYKRQDARLREKRQKQFDKNYLQAMINQRNKMREGSLEKLRNQIKIRQRVSEHQQNKSITLRSTKVLQGTFYNEPKLTFNKENIAMKNIQVLKKIKLTEPAQQVRNINGMGLMNGKYQ